TCATRELTLRQGQTQGAAGSIYTTMLLQHDVPKTCTVAGFPGVSLLDAAGHQLGPAAARDGTTAGPLALRPGQRAAFVVRLVIATCIGSPARSTRIRVFPPDQRAALTLPFAEPVRNADGHRRPARTAHRLNRHAKPAPSPSS